MKVAMNIAITVTLALFFLVWWNVLTFVLGIAPPQGVSNAVTLVALVGAALICRKITRQAD